MTETNQRKKDYLDEYLNSKRAIARLELQLEEVRASKLYPSAIGGDGMPKGSSKSDLSAYAAAVDDLERKIKKEKQIRLELLDKIRDAIESMGNEDEKDLLHYRYIKGWSWGHIADQMGYGYRNVIKIHGKALGNFKIPEKSS
ncbi:MAG: sigma-70 family RNA polymerase sigma factor [Lachnospiraceae bacterium]|nr:sigma-70 family RNA polymerase sigma factor [Lachnospiraceae bacterium]